jgi:hypothetical protein
MDLTQALNNLLDYGSLETQTSHNWGGVPFKDLEYLSNHHLHLCRQLSGSRKKLNFNVGTSM